MKPSVSVVVPTFNRGHCIEECIRSVQSQTYPNLEIIVVDDASRDDTRAKVSRIYDPRLRYFAHEHNLGGAAARNTGIYRARGEYIAFLDSDDDWLEEKLERQMSGLLARGGGYGISYTWLIGVDARGREIARFNPEYEGDCRRQILTGNFIGSFSNVVIRRDQLELTGGLDETMASCQDWDLFIRLLRQTRLHCQRDYLVRYRQSTDDAARISTNPRAVIQGHRRILHKFADEYRALTPEQRREALRTYIGMFAGIGAFGETARTLVAMALDQAGPGELLYRTRDLARAAKRSMLRQWAHRRSGTGAAIR